MFRLGGGGFYLRQAGSLYMLLCLTFLGCVAIIAFDYNRSWNMIAFTTSYGAFLAAWLYRGTRD